MVASYKWFFPIIHLGRYFKVPQYQRDHTFTINLLSTSPTTVSTDQKRLHNLRSKAVHFLQSVRLLPYHSKAHTLLSHGAGIQCRYYHHKDPSHGVPMSRLQLYRPKIPTRAVPSLRLSSCNAARPCHNRRKEAQSLVIDDPRHPVGLFGLGHLPKASALSLPAT